MNYNFANPDETLLYRPLPPTARETCDLQPSNPEQHSNQEARSYQSSIPAGPEFTDTNKTWAELFQEREANEVFICPHQKLMMCKCCANFCKSTGKDRKVDQLEEVVLRAPKKADGLEGLLERLKEQREVLGKEILGVTEKIRGEIDEWYHENVLRLCSIKARFFNDLQIMEGKILESTAVEGDVKDFEESIKKLRNKDKSKGLESVIDFCDVYLDDTLNMRIKKKTEVLRKIQKYIVVPDQKEIRKKLDKLVTISDKKEVSQVKFPILVNVDLYTAANIVRWLNVQ